MAYVNVKDWSVEQVTEWLKGLDNSVTPYAQYFLNNGVNGHQLLSLRVDDLEHLGVKTLGHQEIILESVEHLRNFHYELDKENLQMLAMRLSCAANSLNRELQFCNENATMVETQTLSDVHNIITTIKPLVCWLHRSPFGGNLEYNKMKKVFLELGFEMALNAHRDKFSEKPIKSIRDHCEKLTKLADKIIQEISDPMILQPATLDLSTLKKKEQELGFFILPSNSPVHQIAEIMFGSPAHLNSKIEQGDEIVQVNYQTVVGWQTKKVMHLLEESPPEIVLTLKKRPRHTKVYGQIYMKPYRLPSKKRAAPYSRWNENLPSPQLLTIHDLPQISIPKPPIIENIESDSGSECETPDSPLDNGGRLYPLKPRSALQRRNTITGTTPTNTQSSHEIERYWKLLKNQAISTHSSSYNLPTDKFEDESMYLRDKSQSCSHGLEFSQRPTTVIGLTKNNRKNSFKTDKSLDKPFTPEKSQPKKNVNFDDNKIIYNISELKDDKKSISTNSLSSLKDEQIEFIDEGEDLQDRSRMALESEEVVSVKEIRESMVNKPKVSKSPVKDLVLEDVHIDNIIKKFEKPKILPRNVKPKPTVLPRSLPPKNRGKLDKSHSTPAYDLTPDEDFLEEKIPVTENLSSPKLVGELKLPEPSIKYELGIPTLHEVTYNPPVVETRKRLEFPPKPPPRTTTARKPKQEIDKIDSGIDNANKNFTSNRTDNLPDKQDIANKETLVDNTLLIPKHDNLTDNRMETLTDNRLDILADKPTENLADNSTFKRTHQLTDNRMLIRKESFGNHRDYPADKPRNKELDTIVIDNRTGTRTERQASNKTENLLDNQMESIIENPIDYKGNLTRSGSRIETVLDNRLASRIETGIDNRNDNLVDNRLGSRTDSAIDRPSDNRLGSRTETVIDKRLGSRIESVIDNRLGSRTEAVIDNRSRMESVIDNRMGSRTEAVIDNRLGSRMESVMDNRLGSRTETVIDNRLGSRSEAVIDNRLGSRIECVVDTRNETLVDNRLDSIFENTMDDRNANLTDNISRIETLIDNKKTNLDKRSTAIDKENLVDNRSKIEFLNDNPLDNRMGPRVDTLIDNRIDTRRENLADNRYFNNFERKELNGRKGSLAESRGEYLAESRCDYLAQRKDDFGFEPAVVSTPVAKPREEVLRIDTKSEKPHKTSPTNMVVRAIYPSKSKSSKKKNSLLAKKRKVSVNDVSPGEIQGCLHQRLRSRHNQNVHWEKRWFVLNQNCLYGFKSKEATKAECYIYLAGFTATVANEVRSRSNAFKVYHTGTVFYFSAENQESLSSWLETISAATLNSDASKSEEILFSETDDDSDAESGQSKSSTLEKQVDGIRKFNSLKKFATKKRTEGTESGSTSLDRKWFFNKSNSKKPLPVPTAQFRSYRKVPLSTTIGNFTSHIPNFGKTEVCEVEALPKPKVQSLHASNPSLCNSDYNSFQFHAQRQKQNDNFTAFMTLEELMIREAGGAGVDLPPINHKNIKTDVVYGDVPLRKTHMRTFSDVSEPKKESSCFGKRSSSTKSGNSFSKKDPKNTSLPRTPKLDNSVRQKSNSSKSLSKNKEKSYEMIYCPPMTGDIQFAQNRSLLYPDLKKGGLKTAVQYTPLVLPAGQNEFNAKFELNLDERERKSGKFKQFFMKDGKKERKEKKNSFGTEADIMWTTQNASISAPDSFSFSDTSMENPVKNSPPAADYPGLVYPPVFEPETYSLANPQSTLFRKQSKKN